MPYVRGMFEACRKICQKNQVRLAPCISSSVGGFFKYSDRHGEGGGERRGNFDKYGVGYAIPCGECKQIYVGQTSRPLKDRIREHERAVARGDRSNACARHYLETSHVMNFNKSRIVHVEQNLGSRINLEAYTIAANCSRILNISPALQGMIRWVQILAGAIQV